MDPLKSKLRKQISQDQKIRRTTCFNSARQLDLTNSDKSIEVIETPQKEVKKVSRLEKLYQYKLEKQNRKKEPQRPIFKVTRAPSFANVKPLPINKETTYKNVKSKINSNLLLKKKCDNHQRSQPFQFKVSDNHQFKPPEMLKKSVPTTTIVTRSMTKENKTITNLDCLKQDIKMKNNRFFNSLPTTQVFTTSVPDFRIPKEVSTIKCKTNKTREKQVTRSKAKAESSADRRAENDLSDNEYCTAKSYQEMKAVLENNNMKNSTFFSSLTASQDWFSSTLLESGKTELVAETTILIDFTSKDISTNKSNSCELLEKCPTNSVLSGSLDVNISEKDGPYFERLLNSEIDRLENRCKCWENIVVEESQNITKEILDEIDSSIGQTRLLIRKKFEQFRTLTHGWNSDKKITSDDLQGFWDMIYMQVINLDKRFAELEIAKTNNWEQPKENINVAVTTIKTVKKSNKIKAAPSAGLKAAIAAARKKKLEDQKIENDDKECEKIENTNKIDLDTERVRTRRQAFASKKIEKIDESQNSTCSSELSINNNSIDKSSSFAIKRNKIKRGKVYNLLYGKSEKSETSIEAPTDVSQEFSLHKNKCNLELKTTPRRKSIRKSVQSPGLFMMRASCGAKIAELNASIEKCSINSESLTKS